MASAQETLKQLQAKVIKATQNIEATEVFEKIPDVIRERTRNGFGITANGGNLVKLPRLAKSTVLKRLSLDNNGQLSSLTAPMLSNLTESGKMLSALRFFKTGKKYIIDFDDRMKRNGVKPSEIKGYVEDLGFKFFGLAKVERERLEKACAEKLNQEIKKIFNVR